MAKVPISSSATWPRLTGWAGRIATGLRFPNCVVGISAISVDHRGGIERAGGEGRQPKPDRWREFARRDPRRQVRHRYLDDKIDGNLNDQRDRAPDQAIHHIGGMGMALTTGSTKPSRLRPSAIAAEGTLSRISWNSSCGVTRV